MHDSIVVATSDNVQSPRKYLNHIHLSLVMPCFELCLFRMLVYYILYRVLRGAILLFRVGKVIMSHDLTSQTLIFLRYYYLNVFHYNCKL